MLPPILLALLRDLGVSASDSSARLCSPRCTLKTNKIAAPYGEVFFFQLVYSLPEAQEAKAPTVAIG